MKEFPKDFASVPRFPIAEQMNLNMLLEERKFTPSDLPFGASPDTPQSSLITDPTDVSEYQTLPASFVVGQGEILFVPTQNTQEIATYGLSRCTAIAGFHSKGRVLAHCTENDSLTIKHILEQLQTQFPDADLTLVIPMADPSSAIFTTLHPESQLLTKEHIDLLQCDFPGTKVLTYPCTDVTPDTQEAFLLQGGVPETAVLMNKESISIVSTAGDRDGNILINR